MAPADRRGRPAPRLAANVTLAGLVLATLTGCWSSSDQGADQGADPGADQGAEPHSGASGSAGPVGPDGEGSPAGTPAFSSYAALGDSYTAAPFVPATDLAAGCLRSSGNYPALLAEQLGVDAVRDVSCSAAQTRDVESPQRVAGGQGTVPPQLRAVGRDTDLVTVGLGGNDEALFATLVGCVGGFGPTAPGATATPDPGPCLGTDVGAPVAAIVRTGARVEAVLEAVTAEAPDATVVLVGYPRLLGDAGGCRAFPIDASDVPAAQRLERALRDALAAAARRADVAFLDTYALSAGHEICAADPWVNGRRTDETRALAFHPFAEGQQAVAAALAARLDEAATR